MNTIYFVLSTGLQFFSLVFLMCSLFKVDIKYHKKEILLLSTILTILSCTIVFLNLNRFVFVQIPIMYLLFKYLFQKKWLYSIIPVVATFLLLSGIEMAISFVGVYTHYLSASELNDTFTIHSYIFQTLTSFVGLTISAYILYTSGGYGFSFRKRTEKVNCYIYSILALIVPVSIFSYTFTSTNAINMMAILLVIVFTTAIFLLFYSNKRDWIEFSE